MKKNIEVNLQYEATHNWPEANIVVPEVGFLAHPHHHTFHIKAIKQVLHNDRQIEIILFNRAIKEWLEQKYGREVGDLGRTSCEDLAEEILRTYDCDQVSVLEDGKNGAVVYK